MIAPLQPRNLTITVAESLVTAAAAAVVLALSLPVWIMFVGWISYFTRGVTLRDGVVNYLCLGVGLLLGLGAASVLRALGPEVSRPEQVLVIFGVALVVLSFRFLPRVNNLLGFFLGLVTFFAAHAEPTPAALVPLLAAAAIGVVGGALAHALQIRLGART
jgi:hypothetical protein